MRKIVAIFALLPLLLASCSKNMDGAAPEIGTPLKIRVGAESFASADNGSNATRAVDNGYQTKFEDGDAIGLFVYEYDAQNVVVHSNVKWVFNDRTWAPESDADKVLYGGKVLFIKAYYPYRSGLTTLPEAATFKVSGNQTVATNYANADLLLSPGVAWTASTVDPQILFSHQMAQFDAIVAMVDSKGETQIIGDIKSIRMEASVGDGAVASTITMHPMLDGTFRALLPAQTLATVLTVEYEDKPAVKYAIAGELKSGIRLTCNVNIAQ